MPSLAEEAASQKWHTDRRPSLQPRGSIVPGHGTGHPLLLPPRIAPLARGGHLPAHRGRLFLEKQGALGAQVTEGSPACAERALAHRIDLVKLGCRAGVGMKVALADLRPAIGKRNQSG